MEFDKLICTLRISFLFILTTDGQKRFLVDSPDLHSDLIQLYSKIQALESEVNALKGSSAHTAGGTYIRWGKKTCPSTTSTLVYTGFVAGKTRSDLGSGTNLLCLHNQPHWGKYNDSVNNARGRIFGAEFEIDLGNSGDLIHGILPDHDNDDNVACAVCQTFSHHNILMIPGTTRCPSHWTEEYIGIIMSSKADYSGALEYICVDHTADYIKGHNANQCLLFPVETHCGSLPCGPYVNGRELACVVCSN